MKRLLLEILAIGLCGSLAAGAFGRLKQPQVEEKPVLISRALATRLSEPLQEGTAGHVVVQALDYQCPPCHDHEESNRAFRAARPDVSWRLLQFPLRMHGRADELAKLMLVAPDAKGKREVHERLMGVRVEGKTDLERVLGGGLLEALRHELQRDQTRIEARLELQKRLPLTGTPSYLVFRADGKSLVAHSVTEDEQFIAGTAASSMSSRQPGCQDESDGCKAD